MGSPNFNSHRATLGLDDFLSIIFAILQALLISTAFNTRAEGTSALAENRAIASKESWGVSSTRQDSFGFAQGHRELAEVEGVPDDGVVRFAASVRRNQINQVDPGLDLQEVPGIRAVESIQWARSGSVVTMTLTLRLFGKSNIPPTGNKLKGEASFRTVLAGGATNWSSLGPFEAILTNRPTGPSMFLSFTTSAKNKDRINAFASASTEVYLPDGRFELALKGTVVPNVKRMREVPRGAEAFRPTKPVYQEPWSAVFKGSMRSEVSAPRISPSTL